jgi:hypothetical protein
MIANGTADATHSPVSPHAAAPLPEAAFSLTLKGTIGGHEAMLTVRGRNPQEFQANVAAIRGMLDAPTVPGAQHTAPAPTPAAPATTPDGWCAVHNVQMKRQSNDRGSWWSHKVGDTWCRGK